jgi:hypothetical protein
LLIVSLMHLDHFSITVSPMTIAVTRDRAAREIVSVEKCESRAFVMIASRFAHVDLVDLHPAGKRFITAPADTKIKG